MLREHPSSTLYEASKVLIQTHARRLPLLDYDAETGQEVVISVLTQYRLLKFIAINVLDVLLSRKVFAHVTRLAVHERNLPTASIPSETQDRHLCFINTAAPNPGKPQSVLAHRDRDPQHSCV